MERLATRYDLFSSLGGKKSAKNELSPPLFTDDATIPSIPTRLSVTRLFLELSMYKEALTVLTGVIESDDQEGEAWYLEGWCMLLMSEEAKANNTDVEGLSWKELAQDARDCLETCVTVRSFPKRSLRLDAWLIGEASLAVCDSRSP